MRPWLHIMAVLLGVAVVFVSCQKKDETSPTVEITQPAENAIFNVFDTVSVSFNVMDETELVAVSVQLVNSEFIPIGQSVNMNILSNGFSSSTELVIDDKLLPTGDYYVRVLADDGTNEKRGYRKIKVIALPKQRRAIYCSMLAGDIWKVDSLFQGTAPWLQLQHDVKKLVVNSLKDRLTVVGNYSTRTASHSIGSGSLVWSDDAFVVSQIVRYNDLFGYQNEIYTAWYDREVRGYTHTGSLTMNKTTGDYIPELIYVNEDYLVVEMELSGANDHFLFVYHASTKALLWQIDIPMDVKAICGFDDDEVMLFGNENGDAKVLLYNMAYNGYWEPRQLPSGEVITATQLEGKVYSISHADGIYSYTYFPTYLNLIRAGVTYQQVRFDEENGTIVAATGNLLEELTIQGQVANTVSLPDSISSFDFHYTR